MSEQNFALSPDIQALLAGSRTVPEAPDDLRMRALSRARRAVDGGELQGAGSGLWRLRAGLMAAVMVGVGGLAWALFLAQPPSSPNQPERRLSGQPTPPAVGPRSVLTGSLPTESFPTPGAGSAEVAPPAVIPLPSTASSAKAPSRETELLFLERARHSAQTGNYAATLSAVSEHARRFPQGRLREEREALRVRALSGLGRTAEARSAVNAFRRDFPRSVLLPSLTRMVGTAP